ncbi:hypothetical protein [uncultured Psychroserpens sp.]|uniref:hypothetical protein n=1 Tax=uncultured Psychroserpens sp. TaxID=255436 RepID=UPI0026129FA2|nr:hypothetical protein [uncultured Psychroserpens sp.]
MNLTKFLLFILCVSITSCAYDADDNLVGLDPNFNTVDIISSDSDLFDHLKYITNDEDRPDESIVCIDFIYPLTLFVFDDTNQYLSSSLIINDQEFSDFLETIDDTYSISMSFPITSMLVSGEEFIIQNKEELKETIDSCLSEELVFECGELIRHCVWKIGYSFEDDNSYLGGIFQEADGFTTLNVGDMLLNGSWSPFTIENELHININLNDTTAVGDYFNFDWKVEYIDENSLKLTHLERELILNQRCDPDFADCGNFIFEACETELDSGIAEFILDDYTFCILDTLEFDNSNDTYEISFHETEEDALTNLNPILSEDLYISSEPNQTIYVRINDIENDIHYYVMIALITINC